MMKLKYQMKDLSLLGLLVSLIFIYSCNKKSIKNEIIVKQKEPSQEIFKYNKDDLFNTLDLTLNRKKLLAIFLINQKGEFGSFGYEKNIDIVILDKGTVFDKMEFYNPSILCDVKLTKENIGKIKIGNSLSESLIFSIVESCDGEEPDILKTILWDGNIQSYNIEIPKYFENSLDKKKIIDNLFKNNKDTLNLLVKESISKFVKLSLKGR
ncbi:MAG: hypothetical protein L3J23_06180 [Flavobacteriaceae bacterium]|nr:hypothetical protein [Flavobacteriaceae bacterium]